MNRLLAHVVYINLAARTDRRERFEQSFRDATGITPERVEGRDGSSLTPPPWWSAGQNAWGCCLSHLAVWKQMLDNGWEEVTILEDDAVLADDFSETLRSVAPQLPKQGWLLYLGGQLFPPKRGIVPTRYADRLDRVTSVNRLHGYSLSADVAWLLYDRVRAQRNWKQFNKSPTEDHIDHEIERISEERLFLTLAVHPWIVGQHEGFSDIGRREEPVRWWNY